jgi:Domain of unknown function (DUF5667)
MDPRLPDPKMRDEFRTELRARLMREAVTALAPRPRGTAWVLLRPAMGVGLAAVLLIAGAGTAAAGSLPGDATFPLKKAFENIQVTLTLDDVQRVALLSQIADRRLAELQVIVDRADESKAPTASEEFAAAVARFRAAVDAIQAAAPGDKSDKVQELVDAARGKHGVVLDEVQQKLDDPTANDAIERAKDEENKDTESENNDKDPQKTARPTRTPSPARTASPSNELRATETPRVTQTPRATPRETPRPTGSGLDRD